MIVLQSFFLDLESASLHERVEIQIEYGNLHRCLECRRTFVELMSKFMVKSEVI